MSKYDQEIADAKQAAIDTYKAKVGVPRAKDIDNAAELIGDAMAAWMQSHSWGTFPALDPGAIAVAALSQVRQERADKAERNRRGIA